MRHPRSDSARPNLPRLTDRLPAWLRRGRPAVPPVPRRRGRPLALETLEAWLPPGSILSVAGAMAWPAGVEDFEGAALTAGPEAGGHGTRASARPAEDSTALSIDLSLAAGAPLAPEP